MGLVTIIEQPAKTRWATPAQVAARLGLTPDTATLALLGDLIDEQGGVAERIVNRPLSRARYLERVPGRGNHLLMLSRGPVEAVHSVALRGEPVDPSLYFVADAEQALLGKSDLLPWELTADLVGRSELIPLGGDPRPDYAVDYTAGYVMPEDDQDLAPPGFLLKPELRGAVIGMVRADYYGGQRDPAIQSMRKADRLVTFFRPDVGELQLPPNALSALLDEGSRIFQ